MPLQAEQQTADTAADTIRQQDQRTPQAAPDPHQLLQDAAQHDQQSPAGQRDTSQRTPILQHIPSPLLSPSPMPTTARRSGRESPLTPKVPSRIPGAPEAAAGAASLSYAAALRRSQTALPGAAATASADSAAARSADAGAGGAGAQAGGKVAVFKVGWAVGRSCARAPCWGAPSHVCLLNGCCAPNFHHATCRKACIRSPWI
jgi:hypothetical protein